MLIIGGMAVLVLFFNEDTSLTLNMEYERQIESLNEQIGSCKDSAAYFRSQREALLHRDADLERMAREKFHMQRASEDVYILH